MACSFGWCLGKFIMEPFWWRLLYLLVLHQQSTEPLELLLLLFYLLHCLELHLQESSQLHSLGMMLFNYALLIFSFGIQQAGHFGSILYCHPLAHQAIMVCMGMTKILLHTFLHFTQGEWLWNLAAGHKVDVDVSWMTFSKTELKFCWETSFRQFHVDVLLFRCHLVFF